MDNQKQYNNLKKYDICISINKGNTLYMFESVSLFLPLSFCLSHFRSPALIAG